MDYSRMLEKILTTSEFSHLEKAKQISDDYTAMQYLEDRLVICVALKRPLRATSVFVRMDLYLISKDYFGIEKMR